jgi:hypothetical protein
MSELGKGEISSNDKLILDMILCGENVAFQKEN